ncbi:hypothetical protein B9Z55_007332 [Caenorhabditis nigoni]|uniref:PAN-3 domain-containing protein n=1 Tax=Caenorhabditis nigoni TaxID=1611254 RepID=A0A2G5V9I0_9PELO|nr:hypothetical protein B9Z55_007332 [Caenorhabditis nigoni]
MIRILGKPGRVKTSEPVEISWKNCIVKCRDDINCSVVYKLSDVQCQYFSFGSITTIQKADFETDEMALKVLIPQDQCPNSNPLIPGPTYYTQIINGQFYKTTVLPDSLSTRIYNLTYSVATCPNNTKLFQRGETTVVCIGLYFFEEPLCNNQAEASALCKAQSGTLTGPANADEYEYIQGKTCSQECPIGPSIPIPQLSDISNPSNYTSKPTPYKYLTYWIDGVGTNTAYVYTFEDPTHNGSTNYKWPLRGPPTPKGTGYCLYNPSPALSFITDDPCHITDCCSPTMCWRGALCQVPPIIEMY